MNYVLLLARTTAKGQKLDRSTLEKKSRINWDNDAASRLFNGVHHIYNRINVVKSHKQKVIENNVPSIMKYVLDEVCVCVCV